MGGLLATLKAYEIRWRTMALAGLLALAGVAQEVGLYQVQQFLALFIPDAHVLGVVMIVLPLLFGAMRAISDKPLVAAKAAPDPDSVPGKQVDEGP